MNHLGHGIGLRPQHYTRLLEAPVSGVDWFEAISENYFVPSGRPWAVLDKVRHEVPVVLHGVGMCLGDAAPLSEDYLNALARVIERVAPAWVSDHLCWGSFAGHYTHDLLPLPYNEQVLDHVADKIQRVQDRLGRELVLENISAYAAFVESSMPEWEFLNALTRRTGCRLLVDVNNIYVSSQNLGFDAHAYLANIDSSSVQQVHLAGHTRRERVIIDTHRGPVPEIVWQLYQQLIQRTGPVATLVEWDDEVPAYEVVVAESQRARRQEGKVARAA
jgi:uncharacterized protein (UPF0276 family)